jgi:hypothetical protein
MGGREEKGRREGGRKERREGGREEKESLSIR